MPRFGRSSTSSSPVGSSSWMATTTTPPSSSSSSSSSVRLSCLSPDGRMVHSLKQIGTYAEIESHTLPLVGTTGEDNVYDDDNGVPGTAGSFVIRTRLPEYVISALQGTPPIELLCIDVSSGAGAGASGDNGGEFSSSSTSHPRGTTTHTGIPKRLPKLCIYSKKDVFVLDILYSTYPYMTTTTTTRQQQGGQMEIQGTIRSITEPFESILLGNRTNLNIIRIRSAPQQTQGYSIMSPPGAMAMLTHDTSIHEYALTLYHGGGGSGGDVGGILTTPLIYGVEPLVEESMEMMGLTDFCFLQSNTLSLLSNLSVAFLKATGEVFQASPILFQGTVVPNDAVVQSIHYIQDQLEKCSTDQAATTPRSRQLRSAKQYLLDCFPHYHEPQLSSSSRQSKTGTTHFIKGPQSETTTSTTKTTMTTSTTMMTRMNHPSKQQSAYDWPAQMQGPILLLPESSDDSLSRAISIEVLPAGPSLCGLAIGYDGYQIEFGLIPPTLFIPRFQWEQSQDTIQLDEDLRWGTIVAKVDLQDDDGESDHHPTCPFVALVKDPIIDTVVHYITPTSIKSISTNVLKVEADRLTKVLPSTTGFGGGRPHSSPLSSRSATTTSIKTTGWSCLDVSGIHDPLLPTSTSTSTVIVGAVVSAEVQLGHVLIVRLSNGSMIAVNLTETRQMQEMEAMSELQNERLAITATPHRDSSSNTHAKELEILHETPALVDIAKPLIERTIQGLKGMGKIVGSATPIEQITPELLAASVQIKEQTDREIMLPLMELHEHIRARKKEIAVMFNNQMAQLKSLRDMIVKLREGEASITEKLEIVTENATSMAGRCASVLQAAHDLHPTITQEEFDYFQELSRLQVRVGQWREQLDHLKVGATAIVDAVEKGTTSYFDEIPEDTHRNLVALLDGCDAHLQNYTIRIREQEDHIDDLAGHIGWERDSSHGGDHVRPNQ